MNGFSVLNLSSLVPLQLFGQVFVVAIVLALVSSLMILPPLYSPFLKKDVVPAGPKDPTNLPSEKSKFPTFPHYPTMKLQLNDAQSNLLANMMGWVVLKNQDLFCRGLGVIGGCPKQ